MPKADSSARGRPPFRALRHRNFRLFLAGQLVSLCGTWMQQVALGWLVYRLTGSPFLLGLVGFCSQFPSLLVAPFAGVWADRTNRHRAVLATQTAGMLQAFLIAALALSGQITLGWILFLSAFLGVVSGVDAPTRHAFLVEMVEDREDLPSAVALNSSVFQAWGCRSRCCCPWWRRTSISVTPLGSLFAGALAGRLGAPVAIAVGGCGTLLVAALFARALPFIREDVALPPRAEMLPFEGENPPGAPPPRVA